MTGELISLWLYKGNKQAPGLKKNVFTLYITARALLTDDFIVPTSLTHPRKILLVVLQIGK
jgi:hypothetical protein